MSWADDDIWPGTNLGHASFTFTYELESTYAIVSEKNLWDCSSIEYDLKIVKECCERKKPGKEMI